MTDDQTTTRIEASANEQVPNDVENASTGPQPMLCPPACVGGGFIVGILGACAVERCTSAAPSIGAEDEAQVDPADSVDEIVNAVR